MAARLYRPRAMTASARATLVILCLLAPMAGGCASLRLQELGPKELLAQLPPELAKGKLSEQAVENLRAEKLDDLWRVSPKKALVELTSRVYSTPENAENLPALLLTLAEMHHHAALANQPGLHLQPAKRQDEQALLYAHAAAYAAQCLARLDQDDAPDSALAPKTVYQNIELAVEIHNHAALELVRLARQRDMLVPGGITRLKIPGSQSRFADFEVVDEGIPLPLQEIGAITTARELRVVGLDSHHDRPGIGVPLLVEAKRGTHGAESLFFESLKVPVTGHLVVPEKPSEVADWTRIEFRLVDPHKVESAMLAGKRMPLAADFTTPLAVSLVESGLETLSEKAFFKGDLADKKRGLFLLEPYRPGRVPVVLVHGLLSSPVTWARMVNDLRTDPVIREKYQFWTFFYPSSQPIIYSAAELRQALRATRDTLDPSRQDEALDHMVLVGHSMGGLLSRLQTVDSGDKVWRHFGATDFDKLKLSEHTRKQMRDIFFFDKVPEVRRVVFMGTPHKGSRIGDTTLGRLGATLASPPEGLRKLALEVLRDNPKAFVSEPNRLNSVTGLTVNSPSMKILEECGLPQVPYHTVAGALENNSTLISLEHWLRDLPPDAKTDGVVELSSAVLPGAESELVYPAEHTRVHQEKPGLAEVRRILLEHLDSMAARPKAPILTKPVP